MKKSEKHSAKMQIETARNVALISDCISKRGDVIDNNAMTTVMQMVEF